MHLSIAGVRFTMQATWGYAAELNSLALAEIVVRLLARPMGAPGCRLRALKALEAKRLPQRVREENAESARLLTT